MLHQINRDLHTKPSEDYESDRQPVVDQEMRNHQNFCSHGETYLTLKHAIKMADIGLIRYVLRKVTVMFQAKVAATPNYAKALLRMMHLVDSPAATKELQDAVLSNGLVNLQGESNTNFEVDRLLEMLNLNLKTFQRERSHFSPNSDQLLENWALNAPYLLRLRETFEFVFGSITTGRHPEKEGAEDIWSLAKSLSLKSLIPSSNERYMENATVNLWEEGVSMLGENEVKYNIYYKSPVETDDTIEQSSTEIGINNKLDTIESPHLPPIPMPSIQSLPVL